jgi:hypothetical protein
MYSVGLDELLLFLFFFSKHEYIAKRSGIATFTSEGTTESIDRTKEKPARKRLSNKERDEISKRIESDEELVDIFYGMVIGDAYIELPGNHARLRIKQKDKAFVDYLYSKFKSIGIFNMGVHEIGQNLNGKVFPAYQFATYSLPFFTGEAPSIKNGIYNVTVKT